MKFNLFPTPATSVTKFAKLISGHGKAKGTTQNSGTGQNIRHSKCKVNCRNPPENRGREKCKNLRNFLRCQSIIKIPKEDVNNNERAT